MTLSPKGRSGRRLRSAAIVAIAAFAVLLSSVIPESVAFAQQRPRTVLDMLFGGSNVQPQQAQPQRRIIRRKIIKRKATKKRQNRSADRSSAKPKRSAAPAAPAPKPDTEKAEDARKVLVIGDFLAASLADGLEDEYADEKTIVVEARVDGSSGLVRDDHYDWPAKIGPILEEEDPALLVVMLGSNDRQPITEDGQSFSVRSDGWVEEYRSRVASLSDAAEEAKIPLVWVGMPAFKYDSMSEDMVFLNDIFRKNAAASTAEYVDIWDGFVDENGAFVYAGPGVNGQKVQLRNSDGITMTSAGEEKLAFFVEKAIEKRLTLPSSSDPLTASGDNAAAELAALRDAANATTTPVRSLDDPALYGADALLGASTAPIPPSSEPSPRDKLVVSGLGTGNIEGRADDFDWNEKTDAVAPDGPPIAYRGTLDLQKVRANAGIEPPEEMPSILDAIIAEWSESNDAARAGPDDEAEGPASSTSADEGATPPP